MMKLSVIIPAKDEEATLGLVLEDLNKTIAELPGYEVEVICVDDHCRDRTAPSRVLMARAWWRTGARPARATLCARGSRRPAATCC